MIYHGLEDSHVLELFRFSENVLVKKQRWWSLLYKHDMSLGVYTNIGGAWEASFPFGALGMLPGTEVVLAVAFFTFSFAQWEGNKLKDPLLLMK